jgi:hypothetical protein
MFSPLSNAQAKQFIDATAAFDSLRDAQRQAQDYRGGMHWKTVAGKDYLYRSSDRRGNAKSLGPRSAATEQMLAEFSRRKLEIAERVASLRELADTTARVNAALRLGAVPNEVADVCIALDGAQLLDKAVMVIGTNALHAYAYLGGVRFPSDIMATTDVDLLWSHKAKLSIAVSQAVSEAGLLGILKRADRSYELDPQNSFRARAKSGFMVDLIRQMPTPPWADEPDRFFEADLVATDIQNMDWLLGAPRLVQPVVAVDGRVFMLATPDPRAFAIFKAWLSRQANRDPLKRGRDMQQARAVVALIAERLPHLGQWGALKSFPAEVLASAANELAV